MSSSEDDYEEFIEFAQRYREPGSRRYLRDFGDPFSKHSLNGFTLRYRFHPEIVKTVLVPLVSNYLQNNSRRGLPFPIEIMVLVTLRYYATGSFQMVVGDIINICQQSVSRIILIISNILASNMNRYVNFPNSAQSKSVMRQKFYEIGGFPGVAGCIDCVHIKIKNPGGSTAEVFRNRKGWFSINVQAICGPNLEFLDVVARWPGSSHDSFIFNSSRAKQRLLNGELEGYLLGDSGYAVSPLLMTPFLNPATISQRRYNRSQIKTRNAIERAFGVLKRRFPCLHFGMAIKLQTAISVICACFTLHNLAINCNDNFDFPHLIGIEDVNTEAIDDNPGSDGFLARQGLVERFFS